MKLQSFRDTEKLAKKILALCQSGSLLLLKGDLGVGKTTLVQFVAREIGSEAHVNSPSYTLVHEYPSPEGLLVHIDAYRLDNVDELFELGLEDYIDKARLTVVEWGEGLLEHYPDATLIELSFDGEDRIAKFIKK